MERACIVMEKSEIDAFINLCAEYLHIPEVLSFSTKIKNAKPKAIVDLSKMETTALINELLFDVCRVTGITIEEFKSKNRSRDLADIRFSFAIIAWEKFDISEVEMGKIIGRNHCTAHYYKTEMKCPQKMEVYLRIKKLLEKNPQYRESKL